METSRKRHATTRSYAGLSPEARVARRRQQFMDAGLQLFGSIGYRKTTVRLLCAEAGLTDRYFYESFASIEALLVAVYSAQIDALEQGILRAVASEPEAMLEARIRQGLDVLFRTAEDPRVARVVWIEILGVSPGSDAIYHATLRRFADLLVVLSVSLLPPWPVSDAVARVTCMGLIGAISQAATDWQLGGYAQPREVLVEAMMLMFKGLLAVAKPA